MLKRSALALAGALLASACTFMPTPEQLGENGQAIPVAYTITEREAAVIPQRVLTQVNTLRAQSGLGPLVLDPTLSNAAVIHSRDMASQNRAWHFGSDGTSPADRAKNSGFYGTIVGEAISESYENDIATLNAWMQARETRDLLMAPNARSLGVAWFQEPSRKIWWTLLTGT